jgi:DASH complex subunit DAD1
MENVLQNINRLNRNLEGVIAVGNEFGAVEALWSQFEGVMGKDGEGEGETEGQGEEAGEDEQEGGEEHTTVR